MVRKLSDACRRVLGGFNIKIRYIKIYIRFLGKRYYTVRGRRLGANRVYDNHTAVSPAQILTQTFFFYPEILGNTTFGENCVAWRSYIYMNRYTGYRIKASASLHSLIFKPPYRMWKEQHLGHRGRNSIWDTVAGTSFDDERNSCEKTISAPFRSPPFFSYNNPKNT